MHSFRLVLAATAAVSSAAAAPLYPNSSYSNSTSNGLPVVDLGYGLYQATLNATGQYYNFTNIRYAEPPVGDLRFKAPVPPKGRNTTIETGQYRCICHQATPTIQEASIPFIGAYFRGQNISNFTNLANPVYKLPQTPEVPGVTEDCLKLDVMVPKSIYDARQTCAQSGGKGGAPVLVWIYGGAFTEGDKAGITAILSSPAHMFSLAPKSKTGQPFIFVALNYRLGAFGFMAGPSFEEFGTPNAGLYDQRLALEWVQEHIHLFGGDPDQVTILGESAGGASVLHQITAFGGRKKSPFRNAISQSPGEVPSQSNFAVEATYRSILNATNVTSFAALQKVSEAQLDAANRAVVGMAPYANFGFGPQVDGYFVSQLLGLSFLHGHFDKKVNLMTGHNVNEGYLFTPPYVQSNAAFKDFFNSEFSTAPQSFQNTIQNVLYPDVLDGSYGYDNEVNRTATVIQDFAFICNTYYASKALGNKTFNYLFSVPPSIHAQDVVYTFYNGQSVDFTGSPIVPEIASVLQLYIINFVESGDPNGPGLPQFNMYSSTRNVQNIGFGGLPAITGIPDTSVPARCNYWQLGLQY